MAVACAEQTEYHALRAYILATLESMSAADGQAYASRLAGSLAVRRLSAVSRCLRGGVGGTTRIRADRHLIRRSRSLVQGCPERSGCGCSPSSRLSARGQQLAPGSGVWLGT